MSSDTILKQNLNGNFCSKENLETFHKIICDANRKIVEHKFILFNIICKNSEAGSYDFLFI